MNRIPRYSVLPHLHQDGGYLLFDLQGNMMMCVDVEKEILRLETELTVYKRKLSTATKTIRKLKKLLNIFYGRCDEKLG